MNWTALRSRSHRRREKYGQTVTLTRTTEGSYDPSTGGRTGDSTATYSVVGHVTQIEAEDVDGTLVQQKDKRVELSGQSFADHGITPTDDDKLTIGSEVHEIVMLETVSPGGTAIRHDAIVRAV